MKKSIGLVLLLVFALVFALTACDNGDSADQSKENVSELTLVVTEDSISQLDDYPNLKKVDLTGSTCYQAIADYMKSHPDVEVIYTVSLGGQEFGSDVTALDLTESSYDYDTLLANLKYLPNVTSVKLSATNLSAEQVNALRDAYPDMTIECSFTLDGIEIDPDTKELDLSKIEPDQVEEYAAKLAQHPNLEKIELMDADGNSKLSLSDAKKLKDAVPNADISFSFDLFGKRLTTSDTSAEFVNINIGNDGEQAIRDALDLMSDCTDFTLDGCGIDNEILAGIRDDYPEKNIVWRVYVKDCNWLTNALTIKAAPNVDNASTEPLKYLTSVKYIDFCNNEKLTDIGFVRYMPELEIAIFSECSVVDISPLSDCKKLEFLELAHCGQLEDISPLAQCTSLKYLNLGHTKVKDMSPLNDLPLKLFSYVNSGNKAGLTADDWKTIKTQHPDCIVTYEPLKDIGASPYNTGWRYNSDNSYTDSYKKVREIFGYGTTSGGTNANAPTGNAAVKKIALVVTEATISDLEKYPNLMEANLTGSTCYDAILKYMASHPNVDVIFTVPLGGSTTVKNTSTDLSLKHGSYDYDVLMKNLKYVTELKNLSFPTTSLSSNQLAALKSSYPNINLIYTMATQGTQPNANVSAVDLSATTPDQVNALIEELKKYPNIVWVELMRSNGGSNLSISDVKKLQKGVPNVVFHYSFDLFGKTVSTTDEKIEYVNVSIGNKGESKIREALDILTGCNYFKLDNCGLDNEVLAKLRSDYPRTKVVWRIYQANKGRSWLTDTKVLRAVYGIHDGNSYVLRYCNEVKYMDLGHNTEMVDISFCAYMPDLEIAILSGSPIKDLSPLSNCKKLEFLEIAWCGHLTDVSPLAGCVGLKHLNIGHTRIKNISAIKHLKLEMLSFVNSGNMVGFTEAHWNEFQAMFPTTWITYNPLFDSNASPYGAGWRYTQAGGYTPIYRKVRDVFGYDAIDKLVK